MSFNYKRIPWWYSYFRHYKHGRIKSLYKAVKISLGYKVLLTKGW